MIWLKCLSSCLRGQVVSDLFHIYEYAVLPRLGLLVFDRRFLFCRRGKHYRDRSIHLDSHAIHQRRLILPLQHCVDRRVPEIRQAGDRSGVLDRTVLANDYVKNDCAIHALAKNGWVPLAMKLAAPPQQLPATEAGLGISNSRQGKEREILLHKILRVAHSVAQNAAKTAQNTPFRCSTVYRKLLICFRWGYYLTNFKTAAFNQLGHSSILHCTLNPATWFLARVFVPC